MGRADQGSVVHLPDKEMGDVGSTDNAHLPFLRSSGLTEKTRTRHRLRTTSKMLFIR